jgi:hypothetical protein
MKNVLDTSGLLEHFKKEVAIIQDQVAQGDELIIQPYLEQLYKILEIFSEQKYDAAVANFSTDVLLKTLKAGLTFQILSPLTGAESEWDVIEYQGESYTQNIREFGVFKEGDDYYYNKAIVWMENNQAFVGEIEGISSTQKIKEFPFMPRTFYIEVSGGKVVDQENLKSVYNYYAKSI